MGLFGKVKSFFGGDAPTITFEWLESTIPVTDYGVKYRILVSAEKPMTAISVKSELILTYLDKDNEEAEKTIAEDFDNGANWNDDDQPFPGNIKKGEPWEYSGMVFMEDKGNKQLQKRFNQRDQNNFKLTLKLTLDIKETAGLFDPTVEREIHVTE